MSDHLTYETPTDAARLLFVAPPPHAAVEAGETAGGAATGATDASGRPTLTGYAIVWGATSGPRQDRAGVRRDRMLIGSAKYDASVAPVLALYGHDKRQVLGSTANGTLALASDATGVRFSVTLPDTSYARDVASLVRDGYVAGVSFGMEPGAYQEVSENGKRVRQYSSFALKEITITGDPAFAESTVAHATPARTEQSLRLQKNRLAGLAV